MIDFVKTRILPSKPAQLIIQTILKWQKDECLEMGAALSYYAIFSLFPIVLVILSVVGFLLGPSTDIFTQILANARSVLPPSAYQIVEDVLFRLNANSVGAGITGFFLLLIAASNVFGALDRSVDKIWNVHDQSPKPKTFKSTVITSLRNRVLAFALVLSSAAIMLLSLFAGIFFKALQKILENFNNLITFIDLDEVTIIKNVHLGVTFFLLSLIVMALFKILPSAAMRWNDLWPGAITTSILLLLLQNLVSNSVIRIGSQYRSYGLVGGVMVLMLWIYFTCQIFFIGCEFTYVYSHMLGSRRKRKLSLTRNDA